MSSDWKYMPYYCHTYPEHFVVEDRVLGMERMRKKKRREALNKAYKDKPFGYWVRAILSIIMFVVVIWLDYKYPSLYTGKDVIILSVIFWVAALYFIYGAEQARRRRVAKGFTKVKRKRRNPLRPRSEYIREAVLFTIYLAIANIFFLPKASITVNVIVNVIMGAVIWNGIYKLYLIRKEKKQKSAPTADANQPEPELAPETSSPTAEALQLPAAQEKPLVSEQSLEHVPLPAEPSVSGYNKKLKRYNKKER